MLELLLLLVIVYAICAKLLKTKTAVLLALLYLLLKGKTEGMSERTDRYPWFEPEGYGTSHSMVNPEIKPLMYKYAFEPTPQT